MFRRKWSGLPADPIFPTELKELGYFINKDDEIRSIEDEDNYFKFFINRNNRWNDRQRFSMNQAVQKEIHERLENLGLKKVTLPLSNKDPSKPHVPIFISNDIASKSRVVLIVGESAQDLGLLAHRVVGGPGGVNKGSLVSIVTELQKQRASPNDATSPGIIIANPGELLWWPRGARTLSDSAWRAAPMRSAVHDGHAVARENEVPANRTRAEHLRYVLDTVVPTFLDPKARLQVVAVGDGADLVERALDWDPMWSKWQKSLDCLALVGTLHPVWELQCQGFKEFLRKKARAYALSPEPLGLILSGPDGNPKTSTFTQLGCPVVSSGESQHIETTLIAAKDIVLGWLQEVALLGAAYENPQFEVLYEDPPREDEGDLDWSKWTDEGKKQAWYNPNDKDDDDGDETEKGEKKAGKQGMETVKEEVEGEDKD
ncbi:Arb2 domain-containing protein [Whalleya microplaca]|nr:Arb2 domain-containing protein [Whalleya microplaca]